MHTTTFARLAKIVPQSETHWRETAAEVHRVLGRPGDEAAAKTHELISWEIRNNLCAGSSRAMRLCPMCLLRGVKYLLLFMGGRDRCGTCGWSEFMTP